MRVEFEIRFEQKELEAMCLEKCKGIDTIVPGHFEASWEYNYGLYRVKCTFVPDEEAVPKPPKVPQHVDVIETGSAINGDPF